MFGMGTGGTLSLGSPKACLSFRIDIDGLSTIAAWQLVRAKLYAWSKFYGQAERAISTGKLNVLLRLHTRPINVIVFHGPSYLSIGRSHLEEGFALICFQRLSRPKFATQLCHWRDNWITRALSTPVLSY